MAKRSPANFVYFIQQGRRGPIKIGSTNNPTKRLAALQTANPTPLNLLLAVPGCAQMEFMLHADFLNAHIHGEWFKPHATVLALIRQWQQSPEGAVEYRSRRVAQSRPFSAIETQRRRQMAAPMIEARHLSLVRKNIAVGSEGHD